MADGCRFDPARLTAASRTLPMGVRARVRNLHNNLSVIVTITDRGPYIKGRVIDLSLAAARAIGAERDGVVPVVIEILAPSPRQRCPVTGARPRR